MNGRVVVVPEPPTGGRYWVQLSKEDIERLLEPVGFKELRQCAEEEELYTFVEERPHVRVFGLTKVLVRRIKMHLFGQLEVQYTAGIFSGYTTISAFEDPVFFRPRKENEVERYITKLYVRNKYPIAYC